MGSKTPFYGKADYVIKVVSPLSLTYHVNYGSSGIISMSGTRTSTCTVEDPNLNCKYGELISDQTGLPPSGGTNNRSTEPTACDKNFTSVEGSQYLNKNELGYVTLDSRERVLGIRQSSSYNEKDKCASPRFVRGEFVEIITFSVPAVEASSQHCYAKVFTRYSMKDSTSGEVLSDYRLRLVAQPPVKELGAYPGLENVENLFPAIEVPANVPVPAPVPPAKPKAQVKKAPKVTEKIEDDEKSEITEKNSGTEAK